MTALNVWSRLLYLTDRDKKRRSDDWSAYHIVRACKGFDVKGYFWANLGGQLQRYSSGDRERVVDDLCRNVGAYLADRATANFTLVPIPNSSAVVDGPEGFRTADLANKIVHAARGKGSVCLGLRWREIRADTRSGGTRNPALLEENLDCVEVPEGRVVLFDDVLTTGGHVAACYRKLSEYGVTPRIGVVLGRTVWDYGEKPLDWSTHAVEV